MKKYLFRLALCALLVMLCDPTHAQQTKIPKIGWLAVRPASAASAIKSFQREFSKLGYVDGKKIIFEYRYAEGKLDRLPSLADELVRLKVDLIIAPNTPAAVAPRTLPRLSRSFLSTLRTLLRPGWLIACHDPAGTSRGSPPLVQCWPANDLSCSRKLFPIFTVSQCCGIHRI
jgi:hypothetical protein